MHGTKWLVGAALVALSTAPVGAQGKGFQPGYTDIGATVGLGNVGGSLALGGRFERAIKKLPDLGDGTLAFGAAVDYWSYDQRVLNVNWGWSYLAFGGTANYHFKVENKKIDPFIGLGLGFWSASTDFVGAETSQLYFIGRAGIRYFFQEKMALYADAGASGAAALNVGLVFGLKPAK